MAIDTPQTRPRDEPTMKVFISHAHSDESLVRKVTGTLKAAGLDVFDEESQIGWGDNWAARIGEALQQASAMVVLLTPEALRSRQVSHEIAYALGNQDFKDRLIPVLAAAPEQVATEDIPWILRRLPLIRLSDYEHEEAGFQDIARALIKGSNGTAN